MSIAFGPEQRTASLSVTNHTKAPVTMQVRPFQWRETDGVASLADTADLAASPPFAEIAPGERQTIRLLLRNPPAAVEATYRLLIDQLPPPAAPGVVPLLVRLSLPVFAQPATAASPSVDWRIVRGKAGPALEARNRGNRHTTILAVQLNSPAGGSIPVRTSTHPYLLAGAASQWPVDGARLPGSGTVRLKITSDTGAVEATAPIVSASP